MNQSIQGAYYMKEVHIPEKSNNATSNEDYSSTKLLNLNQQQSYFMDHNRHNDHKSNRQVYYHGHDRWSNPNFNNSFYSDEKKFVLKILNHKCITIYKTLAGASGFPTYNKSMTKISNDKLAVERLGPNLSSLMKKNIKSDPESSYHLSLKTVLQIADQALLRLQYFHMKGYVHGDVNPENFAIGYSLNINQLYLIDYSHAKRYIDINNGEHLPFTDKHINQGSLLFSSINSHRGLKLSRRDDLESLGYFLIYLLTGSLPWSLYSSVKDVVYSKMNTPVQFLCEGLPSEFEQFINSARCLGYSDEPDYSYYRKLFRDLFIREGYIYDYVYDWTKNNNHTKLSYSRQMPQTNPQVANNLVEVPLVKNNKHSSIIINPQHDSLFQLSNHQATVNFMLEINNKTQEQPLQENLNSASFNEGESLSSCSTFSSHHKSSFANHTISHKSRSMSSDSPSSGSGSNLHNSRLLLSQKRKFKNNASIQYTG